MTEHYTGTLKNARWDPLHCVIWGNIVDDDRGRFIDGTYIHTSFIPGVSRATRPDVVKTLNSRYKVEWAPEVGDTPGDKPS